jgi:hypothetical protein
MVGSPRHITSARTAQKIQLPTVTTLLSVTQPLLSYDRFSSSTVVALSKCATISIIKTGLKNYKVASLVSLKTYTN